MIKITIYQKAHQEFLGWKSEGHAGQAPKGYDIICAGVSAVLFGAAYHIKYNTNVPIDIDMGQDGMNVKLAHSTMKTSLAVQQMIIALEAIRSSDGGESIEIRFIQSKG